ncbi:MAG: phosphoribosyltransferase [Chloroflexota bacterium]
MGNVRIISRSSEPFQDRRHAGGALADALAHLRGRRAVVLGVPRGGVVVAQEMARKLDADLDVMLAHKLSAPGHRELAIGAVGENGSLLIDNDLVDRLGVSSSYLEEEQERQRSTMRHRTEIFRQVLPKVALEGRDVVVTDDGVATGATVLAALWAARQESPGTLIAAVPVGAEEALQHLSSEADEVVCLRAPMLFQAVGQFYVSFEQVEDGDVIEVLRQESRRRQVQTGPRDTGGR